MLEKKSVEDEDPDEVERRRHRQFAGLGNSVKKLLHLTQHLQLKQRLGKKYWLIWLIIHVCKSVCSDQQVLY